MIMAIETKKQMEIYQAEDIWGLDNFKSLNIKTQSTKARIPLSDIVQNRDICLEDISDDYLNSTDCAISNLRSIAWDQGQMW